MKYSSTFKATGLLLDHAVKIAINKAVMRDVHQEYLATVNRASDIGDSNKLLGSYALAAYFIALNRKSGLTPEQNYQIMHDCLSTSKLFKLTMGSADNYFSEKNMRSRREWSAQTHQHQYPNDWVVDVLEKTNDYEFGFNYTECGACKLFRDEGYPELASYLCKLDFMITSMMGVHLERTKTLADGDDMCDFRFSRPQ